MKTAHGRFLRNSFIYWAIHRRFAPADARPLFSSRHILALRGHLQRANSARITTKPFRKHVAVRHYAPSGKTAVMPVALSASACSISIAIIIFSLLKTAWRTLLRLHYIRYRSRLTPFI